MLSVNEAAEYMGISLSLMCKLTYGPAIPVYKLSGGKVYLKRDDLLAYMTKNRQMSQDENKQEAINYIVKNPLKTFR